MNTPSSSTPGAPPPGASPKLPAKPLLEVPPVKTRVVAERARLVPGLAAPSVTAKIARTNATQARALIGRFMDQGRQALQTLQAGLKHREANAEAPAEWEREGVDASLVREFAEGMEALIKKFTHAG